MIFDSFRRTDLAAMRSTESFFDFYNRSASPAVGRIRDFLEDALSSYPSLEQSDVAARLRAKDHFRTAEFELLLHNFLIRCGMEVHVHPELENGSARRPDFLVRCSDGQGLYLEAITLDPYDPARLRDPSLRLLMQGLQDARDENFSVLVQATGQATSTPSASKFVRQVQQWLSGLSPASPAMDSISKEWQMSGLSMTVTALPTGPGRQPPDRSLLAGFYCQAVMDDAAETLRGKLQMKASRYGKLELPFVVALNCQNPFLRSFDTLVALFGEDVSSPSYRLDMSSKGNGLWSAGQYSRLSAAWIFSNFKTVGFINSSRNLHLNPSAAHPVPSAMLGFSHSYFDAAGCWRTQADKLDLAELFGLPEDWPGPLASS